MDELLSYWPWLFLLLPVVYFLGWLNGKKQNQSYAEDTSATLSSDYFKGLNYLLADQQDKALPVFLRLTQVDNETVETHLALATIYRRSGNIEKAIELHQNLIARPSLSPNYRSKSLLELGRDYLAAGLFDRAERLFKDVIKSGFYSRQARQYMLTIFQQEKEWNEAIDIANSLIQEGDNSLRPTIAQFFCELSDNYSQHGNNRQAEKAAQKAIHFHEACIRAYIILAKLAKQERNYKNAIKYIKQIEKYDREFFPAIINECIDCYRDAGRTEELIDYLKTIEKNYPELTFMDTTVKLIAEVQGDLAAINYLKQQLEQSPNINGLAVYFDLITKQGSDTSRLMQDAIHILEKMKHSDTQYQCRQCGYVSGTLYWQCPSCHSWGNNKPVTGELNAK